MDRPGAPHRIVIHAGFHKTGTKTLQATLRANATALRALGWRVETLFDNPAMRAVTEAARAFSISGHERDLARMRAETVLWLVGLGLHPGEGLLVSSEDFSGHMPGMHGLRAYMAPGPVLAALVATVAEVFAGRATCEVLFTTRAPDAWLRSLHWQQAKHPHLTADFADFAAAFARAAKLSAPIRAARRALGPAVPVHQAALEDLAPLRLGPAEALLDLAGIDGPQRMALKPVPTRNAMPAPELAGAFIALNRLGLSHGDLKARKEALLQAAVSPGRGMG